MTPFNKNGFRYVAKVPDGERVAAMTIHQGTVIVAAGCKVYRLVRR
jgi:hypothetical protein